MVPTGLVLFPFSCSCNFWWQRLFCKTTLRKEACKSESSLLCWVVVVMLIMIIMMMTFILRLKVGILGTSSCENLIFKGCNNVIHKLTLTQMTWTMYESLCLQVVKRQHDFTTSAKERRLILIYPQDQNYLYSHKMALEVIQVHRERLTGS